MNIPEDELVFHASRSAGPGGQNVNKLNTRITLLWDLTNSNTITERQKSLIISKLSNRIDKSGYLRVVCQKFRTQKANRQAAIEKLDRLVSDVLREKPVRKKTSIPAASRRERLEQKRKRGLIKKLRTHQSGDYFEE